MKRSYIEYDDKCTFCQNACGQRGDEVERLKCAHSRPAVAAGQAASNGKGGARMKERAAPVHPGQEHILPEQACECWKRRRIIPVDIQECRYCGYADFGWQKEFADQVGTCRYPDPRL